MGQETGPAGTMIEARGMTRYFGSVRAADSVDFLVNRGEAVGLIGRNGAGSDLGRARWRPTSSSVISRQ